MDLYIWKSGLYEIHTFSFYNEMCMHILQASQVWLKLTMQNTLKLVLNNN